VLNRDKRLVGIVSLGDLAARNHDSELVGDTMECVCSPKLTGRNSSTSAAPIFERPKVA